MNEPDEDKVFDPFEIEPEGETASKSRGAGIAWLALLVALSAAAASAWLWWLDWQGNADQSGQAATVAALQSAQTDVRDRLLALESRLERAEQNDSAAALTAVRQSVAGLEQATSDLERDSSENLERDRSMAAALFELEQAQDDIEITLAALTARSDTPGQRLEMVEIESLLRLASERLQLFAEVEAADEALVLADERLAAMADPVYYPVRQRISRARQALSELELPDPVLIEGRISALQASVPRLPFPGERAKEPEQAETPPEGLWQRFKHTVSGLVTVRRKTNEDDTLLTIGDKDYLRQGLWLQLETARLSMMRRDSAAYGAALERAKDTLGRFFDPGSPRVLSALEELDALGGIQIDARLPDISAPWSQLQLLRQARPTPSPPAAVEESAPAPAEVVEEGDEETGG